MLEPIDYTIVDKSKVRPEHAVEWGIGNYIYAMVLTYNTKKWGGMLPTSWADVYQFWILTTDASGSTTWK